MRSNAIEIELLAPRVSASVRPGSLGRAKHVERQSPQTPVHPELRQFGQRAFGPVETRKSGKDCNR